MADYAAIYQQHPMRYDRMVSAEDCDNHLDTTLRAAFACCNQVLDVGTGTGRVARLLLAAGKHVIGVEPAAPMLDICRQRLAAYPAEQWQLHQADARHLPLANGSVDGAVAGWAFGHLRHWETNWQQAIGSAIAQMRRVTRQGGPLAIIETLGTGREVATPPNHELAEYYAWLEATHGFVRTTIATDYLFDSPQAAIDHMQFFFGDALAATIKKRGWSRVPEWTGVWLALSPVHTTEHDASA